MFPLINDNRLANMSRHQQNGNSNNNINLNMNNNNNNTQNGVTPAQNGMSFGKLLQLNMSTTAALMASAEAEHFYNHHIIENFIESVREMNDVVLIPSKLKDLDPSTTITTEYLNSWNVPTSQTTSSVVSLNDDLYSYYKMINVVKNDLFEPYSEPDSKKCFQMPKRKISRHQRSSMSRNMSTSSLSSMINGNNSNNNNNNINNNNNNGSSGSATPNGQHSPPVVLDNSDGILDEMDQQPAATNGHIAEQQQQYQWSPPLSHEQLAQQQFNAKQLTLQFNHHLHSLYTILDHFTQAADLITHSYQKEFEQQS